MDFIRKTGAGLGIYDTPAIKEEKIQAIVLKMDQENTFYGAFVSSQKGLKKIGSFITYFFIGMLSLGLLFLYDAYHSASLKDAEKVYCSRKYRPLKALGGALAVVGLGALAYRYISNKTEVDKQLNDLETFASTLRNGNKITLFGSVETRRKAHFFMNYFMEKSDQCTDQLIVNGTFEVECDKVFKGADRVLDLFEKHHLSPFPGDILSY